jgi:hypothetical protein
MALPAAAAAGSQQLVMDVGYVVVAGQVHTT